ncbi:menaquinone reductase molybdopterin-binding-like subunit QrcB [Solidesulfovibrio carbinolicus]|uniref:Molybdopterin oxidoreductase n=1 Tax=Solidesulfovibrio carbinolicus TaxID=296842 RepID=A0A4P6HJE4_9BACT|nr:menaquinone reductase molybdopterin-binding-like subunit QrcB [Solidesulfovibrio carbinolicus]QAZ67217.1 molybdopterin oxidoreductase [Solidesulfovibrio carbinolicus]
MGLDRRAFLGLVAGGTVGAMFTPIPWKLIDDASIWTQNWPWIPRVPKGQIDYVATTSKLCPAGEGLKIMRVAGNPILAGGNPSHPLSCGGVSALARSEVYMLYSPARIKSPMKRNGKTFAPITWEQALVEMAEKLGAAKGAVASISGDNTGTINEVLTALTAKLGSAGSFMMPSEATTAAKAMKLMGAQGQAGYDFENADTVLVLGADIFETWGTSSRNRKAFGASRPAGDKPANTYVYVGPSRNNTAAVCDQWVPAAAADLGVVALGIAWHLLKAGATSNAPGFDTFKAVVNGGFGPEDVKRATGVAPETLAAIAKALASAKAPLVVTGSPFGQGLGAAPVIAGMSLNMLLGRINKPGGVYMLPELPSVVPGALTRAAMLDGDLPAFLKGVESGKTPAPKALLIYDANPVYGLPEAATMAKALEKIPFKVSFSSFMDETAALCDLVLPNSLPLERYDDVATPYGSGFCVYSLVRPIQKPICDTKTTGDVLLGLARKLSIDLKFDNFQQVIKEKVASLAKVSGGFVAKDVMPWQVAAGKPAPALVGGDLWKALEAGYAWTMVGQAPQTAMGFAAEVVAKAVKAGKPATATVLAPYAQLRTGTPVTGMPCQDLTTVPDTELLGDTTFIRVNSETAKTLGLKKGQMVKLSGAGVDCQAKVHIFESVMPGMVSAPLGFGHTAFDYYSQGKGANYLSLAAVVEEAGSGLSMWIAPEVKIA